MFGMRNIPLRDILPVRDFTTGSAIEVDAFNGLPAQ
jgi:hypothetical protein